METGTPGRRLDGWKDIATHLGRAERTVKRWEAERGLPIHRIPGSGRATLFAYTDELDEWLRSREAQQQLEPAQEVAAALAIKVIAQPEQVEAEPAFEASQPQHVAQHSLHRLRQSWTVALAGLALAGLSVAGFQLTALHQRRVSAAGAALTADTTKSHMAASPLVSPPDKRRAHELYLKGRYEWSQRTPESLNRALDDFTQAVVADPNDASSYVGLADTYNLQQIYSTLPLTDSAPRAIAAASRAVQLNDSLAEAHRALAFGEFYGLGEYAKAEQEFHRALQLNPNDAVTHRWYGMAFALPGRYEESLAHFNKAQELDPSSRSTLADEGIVLYNMGRREEGIALLRDVERTNPEFFSPHLYLMEISLEQHDYRTYLNEGQKAADTRDDQALSAVIGSARSGFEQSGDRGFLKNLYAKQRALYVEGRFPPGLFALTCVTVGKKQEALQVIDLAYAEHRPDGLWILTYAYLRNNLREEPGYKALVRKIGFPGFSNDVPEAHQAS